MPAANVHLDALPPSLLAAEVHLRIDEGINFTREDLVKCARYGLLKVIALANAAASPGRSAFLL